MTWLSIISPPKIFVPTTETFPDFSDIASVKGWLQTVFGFSTSTMNDIIGPALLAPEGKSRREYFLSASPAQVIGDLSEVLYGAFLNKLNPSVAPVKTLGGEKKKYLDSQLEGLDPTTVRWKNNQQAATDLLLGRDVGIQVKNAFSEGALTTHSISFISKKTVHDLFLQEFREITLKSGAEGKELEQMTAEAILLKESDGDISAIWPVLIKIYTHYIDLILDLGFYKEDVFAGDKNLFYLYVI